MARKRGGQPRNGNANKHQFYSRSKAGDTEQGPTATAHRTAPVAPPVATKGPDTPPPPSGPASIPSLGEIAADLHSRQQQLATYITNLATHPAGELVGDDLPLTTAYIAAQSLYGQNAARLARIVRANSELPRDGDGNESMSEALNYALAQITRVKKQVKELAEDKEL